jgi:hypothetical protein
MNRFYWDFSEVMRENVKAYVPSCDHLAIQFRSKHKLLVFKCVNQKKSYPDLFEYDMKTMYRKNCEKLRLLKFLVRKLRKPTKPVTFHLFQRVSIVSKMSLRVFDF